MGHPRKAFDKTKPPSFADEFVDWAFFNARHHIDRKAPLLRYTKQQALRVARAQRFRMDERASLTFAGMKKPELPMSQVMPFMRLPFPDMWVHFERDAAQDALNHFAQGDQSHGRIGLLLHQPHDEEITALIVREIPTQLGYSGFMPEMAPLVFTPEKVFVDRELLFENYRMMLSNGHFETSGLDRQRHEDSIRDLAVKLERQMSGSVINLLLLLNSRSEILRMRNYPDTQERANRKNAERLFKGEHARLPLGDIRFNIDRVMRKYPGLSAEQAYAQLENQLVKGHFKVRYKRHADPATGQREVSGVYWWDYYIRNKSRPDITIGDLEPRTHQVQRRTGIKGKGFSNATGTGLPTVNYHTLGLRFNKK